MYWQSDFPPFSSPPSASEETTLLLLRIVEPVDEGGGGGGGSQSLFLFIRRFLYLCPLSVILRMASA